VIKRMLELRELCQALTGRTVSCDFCNNSAKERDEAIKERDEAIKECDEISDVMIALYHKLAAGLESKERQATPMPPHEFREATQQDVERLMNNPIIQDFKWRINER
jgi:phosphoribosylformylglycinamidine (FGAM) synthase PurS component